MSSSITKAGTVLSGMLLAFVAVGTPPGQAAGRNPPPRPVGQIKIHTVRAGTYSVRGPNGFNATADDDTAFSVAPGTYRIMAVGAIVSHRILEVRPGATMASTVTFGALLRARAVASGAETSGCAVLRDGRVACWEDNTPPKPRVVTGIANATAVVTSRWHRCARLTDGSVWCWGGNSSGQLGNGTNVASSVPVPVTGIRSATGISAGEVQTCAVLSDGTVRCWGDNSVGQLGNGTNVASSVPVPVTGISTATGVSASGGHACAPLSDGTVRCWGYNGDGQLGNGTTVDSATPVPVTGVTTAAAVSAGSSHTCAVLSDGAVKCWGLGETGALGNDRYRDSRTPVRVIGIKDAVRIAAGPHSCAVTSAGKVLCWGKNNVGQLGVLGPSNVAVPVEVPGVSRVREVSILADHTCVLGSHDRVTCWGSLPRMEGGLLRTSRPLLLPDAPTARSVEVGGAFSCALTRNRRVVCWGSNRWGEIGSALDVLITPAGQVVPIGKATSLATGAQHACATLTDGTVKCWGCLKWGYSGCEYQQRGRPVTVTGIRGAVAVVAGSTHTCVLLRTGRVSCWGNGETGKLGNGRSRSSRVPVKVVGLRHVTALSADTEHTCAARSDGTVWCWGCIGPGCTGGDSDYGLRFVRKPKQIKGVRDATQVVSAANHSCARTASGNVLCWGFPADDEYGQYDEVWESTPVHRLGNVRELFAGSVGTYAVLRNGKVKRWRGTGHSPEAGLSTLPRFAGSTSIAAGENHSCAVRAGGHIRCWGDNRFCQLGRPSDGSSSPMLMTWSAD